MTGESSIPVTAAAPAGSPLPAPLRHLSIEGVPNPRGRERPVPTSRFAQGFTDDVLGETQARIAAWWSEVSTTSLTYQPSDFGLDAEAWVESADEVVYRIAVAAALAFRLDRDRDRGDRRVRRRSTRPACSATSTRAPSPRTCRRRSMRAP